MSKKLIIHPVKRYAVSTSAHPNHDSEILELNSVIGTIEQFFYFCQTDNSLNPRPWNLSRVARGFTFAVI